MSIPYFSPIAPARSVATRVTRASVYLLILSLLVTAYAIPVPVQARVDGIELPPGFAVAKIVSGLKGPMDMAFLPNDDILVIERGVGTGSAGTARVLLVKNGQVQESPVIEISVNTRINSGLLALTLDPNVAVNNHFYIWYTTGEDALNWSGETVNRLSRFTLNPTTGRADPGSEVIVLDNVPWSVWHNGGGLQFGNDGMLYLATGDNAERTNGQKTSVLNGKVLRIQPTENGYKVPGDNPFVALDGYRPEIFTIGVRNPFRMAKRQADGELFVADVGEDAWEEVHRIESAANFGWATREGPCPRRKLMPCEPTPSQFVDPVLYYPHPIDMEQGGALTALAFYEGADFPEEYQGALFFHDYDQQYLATARLEKNDFEITPFAQNAGHLSDLEFYNDSIYMVELWEGAIYRLYYTGSDNQAPSARLTADKTLGPAPLHVSFSAAGSSDPDDTVLRYLWNFGDGSTPVVTSEPLVAHTYTGDGTYTAQLKVVDLRGGESAPVELAIHVYSGAVPKIELENKTEPGRGLFYGGDTFRFRAVRSGGTEGLDPDTPFTWRVDFYHNQHAHPLLSGLEAAEGELPIGEDNHDGDANVWFRFTLTMLTDDGQAIPVNRDLMPATVRIRLEAQPGPAAVFVDDIEQVTPHAFEAVVNTRYNLRADDAIFYGQSIGKFDYWHVFDDWPVNASAPGEIIDTAEIDLLVPDRDRVYEAIYAYDHPAERILLPVFVAR